MRILVAPDKFKGTLTAREVCAAVVTGWARVRPEDHVEIVPMADGGEGTMDALIDASGGRSVSTTVHGPLGDPIQAPFAVVPSAEGPIGVVEMSKASGLELISVVRRDVDRASTIGTGQLMVAAMEEGVDRVLVCVGGSATNDGGVGMATALGYRFLDASGGEIPSGGLGLLRLARIDASDADRGLWRTQIVAACDVDNPLTGAQGASAVYGPQKGATPDDVLVLDRALGHLAAVVQHELGVSFKDARGAGAAGGLGFGLMAFCGARLRPGVEVVMEALGLSARIAAADLVITGEGSFDEQSLHGKTAAGVLTACELARVPAVLVCGRAEIDPGVVPLRSLVDRVGLEAALADAGSALTLVAEDLAREADQLVGARP
jgi:glycerate 2-kinase